MVFNVSSILPAKPLPEVGMNGSYQVIGNGDLGKKDEGQKVTTKQKLYTFVLMIKITNPSVANQVESSVKQIDGVESAKIDRKSGKLVVKGKVDPVKIRDIVESFTKNKVELIETKPEAKDHKNGKQELKKPQKLDHVNDKSNNGIQECFKHIKFKLNCDSCNQKLRKILREKGLQIIFEDPEKDLVTVKGAVEAAELASYIELKFQNKKRNVKVVDPPEVELLSTAEKNDGAADEQEKEKENERAVAVSKNIKKQKAGARARRSKRVNAVDDPEYSATAVDVKGRDSIAAVNDEEKDENDGKIKDKNANRVVESRIEKRDDYAPYVDERSGGGVRDGGRKEAENGCPAKFTNQRRVYPHGEHLYYYDRAGYYIGNGRDGYVHMFSDENPHSYCSIM